MDGTTAFTMTIDSDLFALGSRRLVLDFKRGEGIIVNREDTLKQECLGGVGVVGGVRAVFLLVFRVRLSSETFWKRAEKSIGSDGEVLCC